MSNEQMWATAPARTTTSEDSIISSHAVVTEMKAEAGDTQLLDDWASKQSELVDVMWSFVTVGPSYRPDPTP